MFKKKKGFTLIEVIVSFSLFTLVVMAANVMLFSTFRSARQAATVSEVNNEGAYVMNSMISLLRYSRDIVCTTATRLDISASDGGIFYYELSGNRIASTSALSSSYLTSDQVSVQLPAECGGRFFTCSANSRSVDICYALEKVSYTDVTDRASSQTNGILFRSTVTLRN